MKKVSMLLAVSVMIILAFVGCTTPVIGTYTAIIPVSVLEYLTGPALAGANVQIFLNNNSIGAGVTGADGMALVNVSWLETLGEEIAVEIRVTKPGNAPSVLRGLIVSPTVATLIAVPVTVVEMASRRAMMDPTWTTVPELDIQFFKADGVTPLDLLEATNTTFTFKIASENYLGVLYIGVGFVPWAQSRSFRAVDIQESTGTLSFAGKSGIVPIHVVAYDYNDARVDYVFFADVTNTSEPVVTKPAPTELYVLSWTSAAHIEYYVDPRNDTPVFDRQGKIVGEFLRREVTPRGAPEGCNIFVQIAWTGVAGAIGYNVYRTDDEDNYKFLAFRTQTFVIDQGFGLEAGKLARYKATAVFADGTESADSNEVLMMPLDIFDVQLISPADGSSNISQVPVFTWKPVKKGTTETAQVGMGIISEENIIYDYLPWIYDCAMNDGQHIYTAVDSEWGSSFETIGPKTISLPFLSDTFYDEVDDATYDVFWTFIPEAGASIPYPYEALEAYKTYEWGMDYAIAWTLNFDETGGFFQGMSVCADLGYGLDPLRPTEMDTYNRFTTGDDTAGGN